MGTSQRQRRSNQPLICRTPCILSYMFFTAPDFWRNREHRSVFSFCWKVLILLHILVASSHVILFAEEKALLTFSDNDSRGGWLSGNLIITVPDEVIPAKISGKISKFVLYWGNNPHQRLGMFRPIVVLPSAESGSRMRCLLYTSPSPRD